jgi:hypothetical protein
MDYNITNNTNKTNIKLNDEKMNELLYNFCHIRMKNEISIHYKYYKTINTFIDNENILQYLVFIVENVLQNYNTFIVHVNIEKLTFLEVEKNKNFVIMMSNILKERFPDKLDFCIIYEGSFIFKQIYKFLSVIIDKNTLKKIQFQE